MSKIEYNNLLFQISQRLDELNVRRQLLIMCRDQVASRSEDSIEDVFSLFEQLEEKDFVGPDRLDVVKEMLKGVKEWALFGEVKKFERKRKEFVALLEQMIRVLDELNDLERLISMCRGKIPEESESNISDVRSLFKVLESNNCLGIDRLCILKEILMELEKEDLIKEVEEFQKRRCEDEEFESRKGKISLEYRTKITPRNSKAGLSYIITSSNLRIYNVL